MRDDRTFIAQTNIEFRRARSKAGFAFGWRRYTAPDEADAWAQLADDNLPYDISVDDLELAEFEGAKRLTDWTPAPAPQEAPT